MLAPQPLDYETRKVSDRGRAALRRVLFVFVVLVGAGWLVPMILAVMLLVTWCRHDELGTHGENSFPYLHFVEQAFTVAFVWLAAVVLTWSVVLLRRVWPQK